MKIPVTLKSAAKASGLARRAAGRAVRLAAAPELLASAAGLAALRDAADSCIEAGGKLEIEGAAPCLLPGYAMYLVRKGRFLACPEKDKCYLATACPGIPAGASKARRAFAPPARILTDLEKCMLAVLSRRNNISTAEVLKIAKNIKICSSCSNEGEVFRAADRLIKFGLVARELRGGVYLWKKLS